MTTIDFGDKNNTTACLNVSSDIIIFGNGQADKLLLNGDSNTVTFGNGNQDAATVIGSLNNITLGNGNQDAVTISGGLSNNVTLGNGNQDSVNIGGALSNARLGNGNGDTAALGGNENNVYVGNGNGDTVNVNALNSFIIGGNGLGDTLNLSGDGIEVFGGTGNTINLVGLANIVPTILTGCNEPMVYIGSGNTGPTRLVDDSSGMQLHIGPTSGSVLLSDFGQDLTHGVIDLIGGVGGFTTTAAVLAALTPDGSGGTQLSLGNGNHLDIQGVLPSALTATNFKIG